MFNFIVKAGGWDDGRDTILASRVFERTDDELVERFKPNRQLATAAVMALAFAGRNGFRHPASWGFCHCIGVS